MQKTIIPFIVITSVIYIVSLKGICGNFSLVDSQNAGTNPRFAAYSPLIGSNLFAAAANSSSNTVSVYTVNTSTGDLTEIAGSPFAAGTGPRGIAFSPLVGGQLFVAVANRTSNTISMYTVNTSTGTLTAASGSPVAAGSSPYGVTFSPLLGSNLFLAVTNNGDNTLSIFQVNTTTGALTAISGSPFSVGGTSPFGVAFSPLLPNGNLFLSVVNQTTNTMNIYQVNTTTCVPTVLASYIVRGSPFWVSFSPLISNKLFLVVGKQSPTFSELFVYSMNTTTGGLTLLSIVPSVSAPAVVNFSPLINGNLFAAAAASTSGNNVVANYQVNTTTGGFTAVPGSPFATGTLPFGVSFSPVVSGNLFAAVCNQTTNNLSVYQVTGTAPTAALTTSSQYISSGNSVTINGTITGGTAPYIITWQDGTVQSGINTSTFSRTVSPTSSTIYYVATISDTNSCSTGPSNTVTVAVHSCS